MSLDSISERFVPDRSQRQWMIAQSHIIEREGQIDEYGKVQELEGKEYVKPPVEYLGAKETYEETIQKL